MLVYENYSIEKVDNLNFRVSSVEKKSQGSLQTSVAGVTYHRSIEDAILKIRNLLKADKFSNSISNIDTFLAKQVEIDKNFLAALKLLPNPEDITKLAELKEAVELAS